MSPEAPRVTVIVTCFNHDRFLVECLESVRAQTHRNVELIIIDDCSTDGSRERIASWLGATGVSARFIAHTRNIGICRSRNEGLRHASGKYVAAIATDDVWLPEKLAVQTAILEREPETTAVVYSDALVMDEDGNALEPRFIERCRPFAEMPDGDIYRDLLVNNFIPAPGTLLRRSALQAVGPYDETLAFEDWDMWLRLARRFRFVYYPVPVARYRIVATSLTRVLWGERRADLAESFIRIRLKHVGQSGEMDRLQGAELTAELEVLYEHAHPRRCAYYRRVARCGCSEREFDLCLLARLRIPCAWTHRIGATLSRRRRDPAASAPETPRGS
jgi:glycosyltransferase involved in cell wall biosynthesis